MGRTRVEEQELLNPVTVSTTVAITEGDAFRERVSYGLSLSGELAPEPRGQSVAEPRGALLTVTRDGN
jgi:hypothetical protein